MPVFIVGTSISVNGKSDKKIVFLKESTPSLINEGAVCLKCIVHPHIVFIVLFLKLYCLFEEIKPTKRGLTTLKCIACYPFSSKQSLPYYIFKRFLSHKAKGGIGAVLHLILVKTIVTMHIAKPRSGFYKYTDSGHLTLLSVSLKKLSININVK